MKLDLTPELGTSGNNTRGTFRAYCCLGVHLGSRRRANQSVVATILARAFIFCRQFPRVIGAYGKGSLEGKMAELKKTEKSGAFNERMSAMLSAIDTAMDQSRRERTTGHTEE